jgi:hypothetical protein
MDFAVEASLERLEDIAHISNKYSFPSLQQWALDTIVECIQREPSPLKRSVFPTYTAYVPLPSVMEINQEGVEELRRLVKLATVCRHAGLMNSVANFLMFLVRVNIEHAVLALTIADESGQRSLQGAAYLEVMQRCTLLGMPAIPGIVVEEQMPLAMNASQKLRMLSGYYRLTRLWEPMRFTPVPYGHSSSCTTQPLCWESYTSFWKMATRSESVMAFRAASVGNRVRAMATELDRWTIGNHMHKYCRVAARRAIMDRVGVLDMALGNIFAD